MPDSERCEELRRALQDARVRLKPPTSDVVVGEVQGAAVGPDVADPTPDADPELAQEIRQLEQALRDTGCT